MRHNCNFLNGKISYSVSGKGRVIILLHGFLENSHIWENYKSILEKNFKVICIDLPGHGQSDCFGYVHSMELMADAVFAVMLAQRVYRTFIVGHSMGGYTALALAEKYPDKIKGLCLFHSNAAADTEERKTNRNRALKLVKENSKKFVRGVIPFWFARDNRLKFSKEIDTLKTEALKTSKQGIAAAIEGMKIRIDREIVLKFSPFMVFYIIGKLDETIPYEQVKMQTTLPNDCEYLLLDNSGHMGFIEEPDLCIKVIKKYAYKAYKKKQ